MKVSDYIAQYIADQGVRFVFGYQGGNIAHTIDSVSNHPDLQFISTYNEQGASFSACGYALENETLGVAMASSGPGAINLISGIASAFYDSIPCLFITGNVSTPTMKTDDRVRQNAFQENDIVTMVSKVTKYAVTVMDPHDLKYQLEKAVYLAKEGRPGPVLIDLPHNIQKADLDFTNEVGFELCEVETDLDIVKVENVVNIVKNSKRPVIIAGGGAQNDISKKQINKLLSIWNIPVVVTLRGLDVVNHNLPNFAGFGGAYGNVSANYALKYADTILVLGARLDERFLCLSDKSIFEKKNIIHVDVDPIELGRVIKNEIKIKCTVQDFLSILLDINIENMDFSCWIDTISVWKKRFPSVTDDWTINKAVYELTKNAHKNAVINLDIGINQMCAAQSMVLNGNQHCYTSAGHGAMGCSLPTAIGTAYASQQKLCDCYVGDGALHMNIQELLMLSRDNLAVHVILNNNNCLGMIRDFQSKAFNSRFAATIDEFNNIDYEQLARAYKLDYCKVSSVSELGTAIEMINKPKACFIELVFPSEVDTNPKLGIDMFNQLPAIGEEEKKKMEQEALACGNITSL